MNDVNDIEELSNTSAMVEVMPEMEPQQEQVEKPQPMPKGMLGGNKTLEDVIQREAKEEQDTSYPFSISKTLGGVIIARAVQRQIWLVLLICAFLIIYINNRYVCLKKMVEIDKMEETLKAQRYKAIVISSLLTEKSRESNIMNKLKAYGDSTLSIPQDPPYLIRVEE